MRLALLAVFAVLSLLGRPLAAEPPEAGDVLVVEFQDGRKVQGAFAGVEHGERLWLIYREAGIELRSGYNLNRIERVLIKGQPVSLASFEKNEPSQSPPWKIPPEEIAFPLVPEHPPSVLLPPFEPMSLDAVAEPANWDADPQADGLRLYLSPRDGLGRTVPVQGQLGAVLESRQFFPGPIRERSDRAPRIELKRWGRSLRPEDFGPAGAIVELPFDGRGHDLRGLGVPFTLRVRLGIPGQNVLEAVTPVLIGLGLP